MKIILKIADRVAKVFGYRVISNDTYIKVIGWRVQEGSKKLWATVNHQANLWAVIPKTIWNAPTCFHHEVPKGPVPQPKKKKSSSVPPAPDKEG